MTWTQNRFSSLILNKNIAKGTTDPRVDSGYQSNFFSSYHKFSNKSLPDFIFIFSTKQQLQNLNQISAFQLNLNFKILTECSFRILTKIIFITLTKDQQQNTDQIPASKLAWALTSKSWTNLCSKSGQKFDFMTKLQLLNLQGHINQVY